MAFTQLKVLKVIKVESIASQQYDRGTHTKIYPNADQIRLLRECNVINRLPDISKKVISDNREMDAFMKAIAVAQLSYIIASLVTRAANHLPVSQLEITTLAFSTCAFITYFLLRSKPRGVNTPTDVTGSEPICSDSLNRISREIKSWTAYDDIRGFFGGWNQWTDSVLFPPENDLVWNEGLSFGKFDGEQYYRYIQIGFTLAGTVLGSIHCIAWNFEFPSFVEIFMWRTASLLVASALPVFLLSILHSPIHKWVGRNIVIKCCFYIVPILINLVYIVARLCLLVLVVRTLFYLPSGVHISTWADQIPHVA